jgi:hypothetical protein
MDRYAFVLSHQQRFLFLTSLLYPGSADSELER